MKSLLTCLSLLIPSLIIAQDLKMTNVVTTYGKTERKQRSTIFLSDNALRTDQKEGAAKGTSTIYKSSDELFYTIDHADKSYRKITKEDIERMERSMEQMQERLEQMPEEQRKKMKEMMGDKMASPSEGPDITYRATGNSKKVAPWGTCQEYKGVDQDGNTLQKVYTTPVDRIKVNEDHFGIFNDLIDFLDFLPQDMDKYYPVRTEQKEQESGLQGFGVLWVYYDEEGNKTQKMRVKEMKKTSIPSEKFTVPSDYEGKKMQTGSMGRR